MEKYCIFRSQKLFLWFIFAAQTAKMLRVLEILFILYFIVSLIIFHFSLSGPTSHPIIDLIIQSGWVKTIYIDDTALS